jgi:ABC transporter DrrB family efflux protein
MSTAVMDAPTVAVTSAGHGRIVSDTLVVAKRNLIRMMRTPQLIFFNSIQPVMFVLLFRYVFGGAINTGGDYVNYLIPGILVQTSLFGGAGTALGLSDDISKGIVDRFRSLPMARSAVLTGRILADVVRNLFVITLMTAVGIAVGFRFNNGVIPPMSSILVLLAFGFAFSWLFALIGLSVRDPESAQIASFLPVFPLTFASSTFVPLESMPGWLQAFARNQPVTHVTNTVRSLTQGDIPGVDLRAELLASVLWIVGITAVFSVLAVRRYRKGS